MSSVKASVLHAKQDLRLEDRFLDPPAEDEVQISIASTGLCGSDLHYFNHFRNGDIQVRQPLTLGHESSGRVVAVGSQAAHLFAPGDRVALEVGLPCEACADCKADRYNICAGMRFRSSAKAWPHFQGTLQETINHPAKWCHKLPDVISNDLGALIEPLSVAVHAHRRAALDPSRPASILVLGAGAVGLLVAAVVKSSNPSAHVVIADVQQSRIDFAFDNSFAHAGFLVPLARPEGIEEKLQYARSVADLAKQTVVDGRPAGEFSAVFECTGIESCMQTAIYASKPGGRILIIGMGNPILTLPVSAAALREVDMIGVFRYANTYPAAIDMLSNPPAGLPDLEKLVTHRVSGIEAIPDAFAIAARPVDEKGGLVLKVVVDMA